MRKGKFFWTIIRTFIFIVAGLMNTVWIRPADIGSWENYLGYVLLLFAAYDIAMLIYRFIVKKESITA